MDTFEQAPSCMLILAARAQTAEKLIWKGTDNGNPVASLWFCENNHDQQLRIEHVKKEKVGIF